MQIDQTEQRERDRLIGPTISPGCYGINGTDGKVVGMGRGGGSDGSDGGGGGGVVVDGGGGGGGGGGDGGDGDVGS